MVASVALVGPDTEESTPLWRLEREELAAQAWVARVQGITVRAAYPAVRSRVGMEETPSSPIE